MRRFLAMVRVSVLMVAPVLILGLFVGVAGALALGLGEAPVVDTDGEHVSPVTLTTRFRPADEVDRGDGVVLAGLAADGADRPTTLALTWSPVDDGWFGQVWGLQLVSDSGLIPQALAPKEVRSGLLKGSKYISLAVGAPVPGHEYEAVLAYTPNTGLLTVVVTDVTEGTPLVVRGERLLSLHNVLYPALDDKASQGVSIERVVPAHLPVGMDWVIVQPGEDGAQQVRTALERHRPVQLQLRAPGSVVEGELRVALEAGEERIELLRALDPQHLSTHDVSLDEIAPGGYDLVTTYVAAGGMWEVGRRAVNVGRIDAAVGDVGVQEHETGIEVWGTLELATDGPLQLPSLAVDVSVVRHTFTLPSGVGSGSSRTETVYTQRVSGVGAFDEIGHTLHVPFAAQVDWKPADDSVWEVRLTPVLEPDVLLAGQTAGRAWLGQASRPFAWDGLLQVAREYVNPVVPGVVLHRVQGHIAAGPIEMYLLEVDLTQPGIRLEAMTGGSYVSKEARWPRALVSDMVMKAGAVAGVNGSFFFLDTMLPRSMLIRDWQVLRSPGPAENAVFGVTDDGKPYVGVWEWSATMRKGDGIEVRISGVNTRTHGRHGIVIYRSPWLHSPGTTPWDGFDVNEGVVEAVVADVQQPEPGRMTGRIVEVRTGEPGVPLQRPDVVVVSGRGDGAAQLLQGFAVGDRVEIEYELPAAGDWLGLPAVDELRSAVSGGVVLVRNGTYGGAHIDADTGRHPRAAVGVSYDRSRVYFLVADGRSQRSVGLTYKELADIFLHIGAHEALNLDSGGSSTMVIRQGGSGLARVMNFTSDGTERPVADGIGVFVDN